MHTAIHRCAVSVLFLLCHSVIYAQDASSICAKGRRPHSSSKAAKTAIADPAEAQYDVHHVKINISLTIASTAISGDATTTATVVAASMPRYVFELDPQLTVDSCKINGVLRAVSTLGAVRTVALPAALPSGSPVVAQVFYHGQPVSGTGFNTSGLSNLTPTGLGSVTFTLSEPYESADWWPCKMDLTDKADSSDVWITVADTLKAGSNGTLQAITALPGNRKRYEWKNHNPIAYYNISAAVAQYLDYSFYAHFSGSTDSVLIQNYIYDNQFILADVQPYIDSIGLAIDYFSTLFGRYPFWKEKYGHCMVPIYGGQENQTMTSFGGRISGNNVLPHELSHQWWGNQVTCASFHDIWLNEGFASYCEHLYAEHYWGPAQAAKLMTRRHLDVISRPGGSVYVDDTTDENRIFDSRLTYAKGGAVVHMLRYLAGSDAVFFSLLRAYQQQYKGSVAYTADLQALAQSIYGRSVDSFFRQWIYGEGVPAYDAVWNQKGGRVFVQLSQTTSAPASVAAFDFPVEVKLAGPSGDTVVTINMAGSASAVNTFTWSRPVTTVVVDPNDWIPDDTGSVRKDIGLNVAGNLSSLMPIVAYPNPSGDEWHIANMPEGSSVTLTDGAGRIVWQQQRSSGRTLSVSARSLPAGFYLLHIQAPGGSEEVLRLSRCE